MAHPSASGRAHAPRWRAVSRERVDGLFDRITEVPVTTVIAPAGSGKTTALTQYTERTSATVAWLRSDALDGTVEHFVAHLDRSLADAGHGRDGGEPRGWHTIEDAVEGLARPAQGPVVVIVDDFHLIRDRPAASAVEHLVTHLPEGAHLVLASRSLPVFDLTRLLLSGRLLEIGADELRFRTWEAERLVTDVYGLVLGPEDVARLTRRVDGWAAGFQLYHLAVRNKPPAEQRRFIDIVSSRSTLARQYLTRNVLDGLPEDLREFLLVTSVLGVVSARIADEFLGRTDSARHVRQLEELQLFVVPLGTDGVYRYHEVLRSHLETELGDDIGHERLVERFAAAAPILERAGYTGEALRCSARAGRWDEVSRLVGSGGDDPFDQLFDWLDLLPSGVADDDPWLMLARARAELTSGRIRRALGHYRRAEELFGDTDRAQACDHERRNIESLLDPFAPDPPGWLGELRRGLRVDPAGAAAALGHTAGAPALLARGLLTLSTGDLVAAAGDFDAILLDDDAPTWTAVAAHLGRVVTRLVDPNGPQQVDELDLLARQHEHDWFARLARALLALTDRSTATLEARRIAARCRTDGDPWGEMLALLCAGIGELCRGDPDDAATVDLLDAAELARAHHATLVELLAVDAAAVAGRRRGDDEADGLEHRADRLRRSLRGGARRPITYLEAIGRLAAAGDATDAASLDQTIGVAQTTDVARTIEPVDSTTAEPTTTNEWIAGARDGEITVRCFGRFSLRGPGGEVDLAGLRPRARSLVHLLARRAGDVVHADVLKASLWPDASEDSARRSLQVAASAARKALEAVGGDLRRDGDGYVLIVDGVADVALFERSARDLERAVAEGRSDDVRRLARIALESYAGELLPDEGAADWVVRDRERLRLTAAGTARVAALAARDAGEREAAIHLADRGLAIDRFDDGLWQLLIALHDEGGETGAAERTRRSYAGVLDELGVEAPPGDSVTSSAGTRAR